MQIPPKCRLCIKMLCPTSFWYTFPFILIIGNRFTGWQPKDLVTGKFTAGVKIVENSTLCFHLRKKYSMSEALNQHCTMTS